MAEETLADVKRALAALRAAKARITELERARSEPVAVVGVGCRFPGGADDPDAFWRLLAEGRDGISPVPADRWDADAWYHPDRSVPGRSVVRRGGFLAGIDQFDPDFFGLSDREAEQIDPQQRLLLEVSAEALERAGQSLDRLRGSRTGAFVAICGTEYAQRTLFSGDAERIDGHSGTGSAISMAAGRLAYVFGLEGPALTVDTACSSSLVAVHLACQALRGGECDLAVAAGVNVMLSPLVTVFFSRLGVLSPSGRVRAFDAAADGYLRSDGCGAVALKRLSDAIAAKDPIVAVIRGSATGNNGRGNGMTSPNGRVQEATIRRALDAAGRTPDDVGYVEAFGAATPLGDRIELEALDRVFGRARATPLYVGSVKTNLGHAEGAAGMASLIKAVLAVGHGEIPPTLHWERPPAGLPWGELGLRVPVAPTPWPSGARCAGVSAFGFSGTNAHVVVESAPPTEASDVSGPWPIALSGRTEQDVRERARRLLADPGLRAPVGDIAYTLARRAARPVRAAFVARDRASLEAGLRAIAEGAAPVSVRKDEPVVGAVSEDVAAVLRDWAVPPDFVVDVVGAEPSGCDVVVRDVREPAAVWVDLFLRGATPSLDVPGARAVPLSPSPFFRQRYWVDAPATSAPGASAPKSVTSSTSATSAGPVAPPAPPPDVLRELPEEERADRLQGWLLGLFAALMRKDAASLDAGRDLTEQGLDSLVAVDAIGRVLVELGVQLYPTELFEHATIAALARHLARALAGDADEATDDDHRRAREAISAAFPARSPRKATAKRLPGPVFVLSSPRAGSTLLRVMLAGHPRLFAPPELHLLLADDLADWHARLSPELLTLGLAQAWMGLGLSESEALRRVEDAVARREPTPETYAALLARLGDRVLVDKSPSYGFDPAALARAERWFEGARYVHLVRHPAPVIESFARLRMGRLVGAPDAAPRVAAEQAWAMSAERIGAFLGGVDPERQIRVRYEDLVADPRATMERLCAFLGVPLHDATLDPYQGDRMVPKREGRPSFLGDPGFSRHGRIDASLGERWRDAPAALQPETAALARSLGYDVPTEGGASPPEMALPDDVRATGAPSSAPFRSVLLTGATGFLGAWLLADLLDRADAVVTVLVRAATPEAGLARVRDALAGIGRDVDESRVRVVLGDLARPRLGLSDVEWTALSADVDAILHNGAVVHFSLGRRQLAAPNVGGTLEVLRLAATGRCKPVLHVSTKGVFSPSAWPGDDAIGEDAPLRPVDGRATGYQQTKWAAERLVAAARERGVPTAIVRPGRIAGDVSGRCPEDDLLVRFVRGCVEVGAAPDVPGGVETVPVDVVSRSIVDLLGRPDTFGRAFHLVHDRPVTVAEATACVRDAGYDVALVPYPEWRARLRARIAGGQPCALAPLIGMFGDAPPDRVDDRRFDASNARSALGASLYPPVTAQLSRTLRWLAERGLLPSPEPR